MPATQSADQAVLGVVQKHFTHAVALARQFQEVQHDLDLGHLLDSASLADSTTRRAAHDRLAKLDAILAEHRGHYRQLMARFDAELVATQAKATDTRRKSGLRQLVAMLKERASEQAETFRLREEWAGAARELLRLIESHAAHIQFDAEGLVFEDPELVERCGRLTDRIAQIATRETDFAAQQRLRMLETAQRLGVRIG